ncbi:MAG: oligosaccharide flippase family protein [Candidatus Pacearchaeota archaeon]|nr:oligosaccharide flippase family protein [Candidatus Pacearchaeota archaeon]
MVKFSKELFKGSLILLITFNLYNILNFFFQFSMARLLTIVEYGILATLFSFIYILNLFSESIQTIITKYSSIEEDKGKLKNIIKKSLKKALKISSIFFLIYVFIAIPLSYLLKMDYFLLFLNGLMIFAVFILPVPRGIMQGKKRFYSIGLNLISESVIKLGFSILLVILGWKVYGALTATILGFLLAFLFSFFSLRDIFFSQEKPSQTEGIYQYTKPVFVVLLSLTIFFSIDVIIAKIVFSEQLAGSYAVASILAKIIFIGTNPISKAMFSISSENSGKKKKQENLLFNSILILIACIVVILFAYYFFPDFIVRIFSGKVLSEASSILFYLAIAFSLLSISNLFILYGLSLGKIKNYFVFISFPIIEAILLFVFSSNLFQFSIALVMSSAIFLWGSIILSNK